jgi:DNA-binding beta-propeller fold protein YncE
MINKNSWPSLYELKGTTISKVTVDGKTVTMGKYPTDSCYSPTGKFVYVIHKDKDAIEIYDAKTWKLKRTIAHPAQPQPETIALCPNGVDVVVGSEGKNTKLQPVQIPAAYL